MERSRHTAQLFLSSILSLGIALVSMEKSVRADGGCRQVAVDCGSHQITLKFSGGGTGSEEVSTIDCGKPGHETVNGNGFVGGPHSGAIVKHGVEIEGIPGMGDSGGGKVFHTPFPEHTGQIPKGENISQGCIHVDQKTLEILLGACHGKPLTIVGASSKSSGSANQIGNQTGNPAANRQ